MSFVHKRRNNLLAIGMLALLGIFAAGIAHWSMSSDIGVTPDSMIYLTAAERLAEANGLTPIGYHFAPAIPSGQPMFIYPPAYPVILAATSLFTNDILTAAKYLHSFLFAANIFLVGLIVYLSTRSIWPALCAIGLVQTSFPLLNIYTMALTEPLFIFFLLLTLLGAIFYIQKAQLWVLLACGSTAAFALMTRYAAITILLPLVLTVLIQKRPSRVKFRHAVLVVGVTLLPLIGWVIRNRLIAGSSTGRSFAFHFIGTVEVSTFVDSLMFLLTPYSLTGVGKILLLTSATVVVVCALWSGFRGTSGLANRCARFFSAAMIATYVIFLAVYNSFANPAVDLGPRVALPVYVFGMILVFSLVEWDTATGKRRILFWCVVISSFVLFAANLRPAVHWMSYRHREGEGFTSRAWKDSETVRFLKTLPTETVIFSNAADVCYLFTKREALRLPAKYDPTRGRDNTDFDTQITELREKLGNDHALVVYFDRITWRWYLPAQSELEGSYKLPVAKRLADGVVFGAQ